jgi:hypothetical protein
MYIYALKFLNTFLWWSLKHVLDNVFKFVRV